MHRLPRLSVLVWISTGTWIWGRRFLAGILTTLRRADVLFDGIDPIVDLEEEIPVP
jgi:hypothetical protein